MGQWAEIRHLHLVEGGPKEEIARRPGRPGPCTTAVREKSRFRKSGPAQNTV